MFKYAQLNDENAVIGISQLSGEVVSDNLISIDEADIEIGSIYDRVEKTFTPPVYVKIEPTASLEEQILAETQYQTALIEMQTFGGM